jgi:transposase
LRPQAGVGGRQVWSVDARGQLEAEVADLTQALGEAAVELWVWKKSAEGRLGLSRTLRWIRVEAGMST